MYGVAIKPFIDHASYDQDKALRLEDRADLPSMVANCYSLSQIIAPNNNMLYLFLLRKIHAVPFLLRKITCCTFFCCTCFLAMGTVQQVFGKIEAFSAQKTMYFQSHLPFCERIYSCFFRVYSTTLQTWSFSIRWWSAALLGVSRNIVLL